MIKTFFIVFILTLTLGCTQLTTQILSVSLAAAELEYYYEDGQAVDFVGEVQLTDLELSLVIDSLDQIDASKKKIRLLKTEYRLDSMKDIIREYNLIKSSYLVIRRVVIINIDKYSYEAIQTFYRIDEVAKTLDDRFTLLIYEVRRQEALMTTIQLADTVIKIATLL